MHETPITPISFETHPSRYRHWRPAVEGDVARLTLDVDRFGGLDPTIELKGNSYELSVDIELADAVQRLRFEHPAVRAVVIESADDRIFCSGANIHSLARSTHAHKVNFCKFTNETRLYVEEASAQAGQRYIAACAGATAGGGYELALACDEILLVDDGASAISLPEVPLLAVLPGTGGLTRLIDKRRIRPDRADLFSTTAEGVKGKRALEWRLVDTIAPRTRFAEVLAGRIDAFRAAATLQAPEQGIILDPLAPTEDAAGLRYRYVTLAIDNERRVADLTILGPSGDEAQDTCDWWPLRMARELDDALLQLRFNHPQIGLIVVRTRGGLAAVHAMGETLASPEADWLARETRYLLSRVLRRLDLTARSIFAVVDEGSCYGGPLFELLLAADRTYVLDAPGVAVRPGRLSDGPLPKWNGLSRLQTRFLKEPEKVSAILNGSLNSNQSHQETPQASQSGFPSPAGSGEGLGVRASGPATNDAGSPYRRGFPSPAGPGEGLGVRASLNAQTMDELGLATHLADEIDFEDDLRLAIEERASLSPDALTGMEASLRFGGPETMATRIFGRLSAWQNWIFTRPNATGETGALTLYGKPTRPHFDYTRT